MLMEGSLEKQLNQNLSIYILCLFSGTGDVFLEVEVTEYTHFVGK